MIQAPNPTKGARVKGVRVGADIFRLLGGSQGIVADARDQEGVPIVSAGNFGRVEIVLVR